MQSAYLPYDFVFEILSRSSTEVVHKSKLVSKDWNELTYEPVFMEVHKKNSNTISGYFIQGSFRSRRLFRYVSLDSNLALDFLPSHSEILASSDHGILCCFTKKDGPRKERFYVCKPTTKQVQMLPNPKLRYFTVSVALVVLQSNPLWYKIIRISENEKNSSIEYNNLQCEIFDSKNWAWKQSDEILLPWGVFIDNNNPCVLACGRLHWLTTDKHVLCFDLEKETYTTFPSPNLTVRNLTLVKYKGHLAIIWNAPKWDPAASQMEAWLVENYVHFGWKKMAKDLGVDALRKKSPYTFPNLGALHDTDTALMKDGHRVLFYNFHNSSIKVVKLGRMYNPGVVFPFRSDFEPVNLKGRK